jgi:hypothetical protein
MSATVVDTLASDLSQKATPSRLAIGAAVTMLLIWLAFAGFLLSQSATTDVEWARLAWVFTSIEAVAFAGAGLLFGTAVNRQRAEKAEQRAETNQKDAEAGRTLAAAIKADDLEVAKDNGGPTPLGGSQHQAGSGATEAVMRHARLARQLFP